METIRERLQAFLDHINVKPYKAEIEAGISVSSLSRFLKGKDMGVDNLMKIHIKYPELNLDWLFRGEGPMLYTAPITANMERRIDSMMMELGEMKQSLKIKN